MNVQLKGLGTRTKRLAGGRIRYYITAWRTQPGEPGAPVIATADGPTLEAARHAAQRKLAEPAVIEAIATARGEREALRAAATPRITSLRFIDGLATRYLAHLGESRLSPGHRKAVRRYIEHFRDEHGDWRVSLFERPEIVRDIVQWRNHYAETPRSADYAIAAVSAMFTWAREQGLTAAAPCSNVRRLHVSNRGDLIWRAEHFAAAEAVSSPEFANLLRLAAYTGLRQADLLALPWSAVSERSIARRTNKRGRLAAIPLIAPARALLSALPRTSPIVAVNTHGRPWTRPAVLSAMRRMKAAAIKAGAPDLARLHFHDLRGTACTHFRAYGLKAPQIALIMGWSERRVEEMLAIYTSTADLLEDILAIVEGSEQQQNLHTDVHTAPAAIDRKAEK